MTISTVSNNTAGTYLGTYNGVVDGLMVESTPTVAGATSGGYLIASSWTSSTRQHSVIKFPTSSIATDQTVSAVNLMLRQEQNTGSLAIYQLKVPFVFGQASWNERSTGVSWTSGGGLNSTDVELVEVVTTTIATSWNTLTSAALVALVDG